MKSESQGFFKEIHRMIEDNANIFTEVILGQKPISESFLGEFSQEEENILRSISLDKSQKDVLRQALRESERGIVFEIMCIIDGVHYTKEEIPDLAIINRSTQKEINQDFLHDEFYEAIEN